ncbi:hypothetical protein [Duncaniella muris]|uniref:hypothetical protein n=1 Tax=Duncaniella muris TaxID=2094150 RepID=UPI0025B24A03|nr:hypothetical protein [Duncaniella muris]
MKQKIKEALRQEYKSRLELNDEQLDGMAAFAMTFANVTEESNIEEFVKNDATLAMLKSYQSVLDKDRAKRKGDGDQGQQGTHNGNNPPEPNPQGLDVDALVERLNAAWEQKLQPLQEKLNAFETAKSAELAVKTAQDKFGADAWVNGYPELRDSAWAQAIRIYERTGKSMTADELHTEAMEIFKPLAKAKGLDISKPFQSDGGAGGDDADFSAFDKAAEKLGWVEPK